MPSNNSLKKSVASVLRLVPPRIHAIGGGLVMEDQFLGVEQEVENCTGKVEEMLRYGWQHHEDGSLRNNGAEWVFNGPVPSAECVQRLLKFEEAAVRYNWQASFRTSTHVHIGFSQDTPYKDIPEDTLVRVQNFLCLYYLLEEAFFAYAADDRKVCGYCEPFSTCPDDFIGLISATTSEEFVEVVANSARYYGCNPQALRKHGTIEFRHLPLTIKAQGVIDWINIILRMKKWAYLSIGDNVVASLREAGKDVLLDAVFADQRPKIEGSISDEDFERRLGVIAAATQGRVVIADPWGNQYDNILTNNAFVAKFVEKTYKRKRTKPTQEQAEAFERMRQAEQRLAEQRRARARVIPGAVPGGRYATFGRNVAPEPEVMPAQARRDPLGVNPPMVEGQPVRREPQWVWGLNEPGAVPQVGQAVDPMVGTRIRADEIVQEVQARREQERQNAVRRVAELLRAQNNNPGDF